VHGQCRQVNAGVVSTTGPVLGVWMLPRFRVSCSLVWCGLLGHGMTTVLEATKSLIGIHVAALPSCLALL
jgi:hypothetical protein